VAALETKISVLEEARASVCFSTGMAAIAGLLIALLRAGDHIISSQFLFGNTNSLLQTLQGLGVSVSFVDATRSQDVEQAIEPTRAWFLSKPLPTRAHRSPTWRVSAPSARVTAALRRRQHLDDAGAFSAARRAGQPGRALAQQGHQRTW